MIIIATIKNYKTTRLKLNKNFILSEIHQTLVLWIKVR